MVNSKHFTRISMHDSNTRRFAKLNESDINKLLSEKDSKSTKKSLKIAKNLFLDFLNTNFLELSEYFTDRTGNDSAETPDKAKLDRKLLDNFLLMSEQKKDKDFKNPLFSIFAMGFLAASKNI